MRTRAPWTKSVRGLEGRLETQLSTLPSSSLTAFAIGDCMSATAAIRVAEAADLLETDLARGTAPEAGIKPGIGPLGAAAELTATSLRAVSIDRAPRADMTARGAEKASGEMTRARVDDSRESLTPEPLFSTATDTEAGRP